MLLVGSAAPAMMEHQFVDPFVAILFEKFREKTRPRIRGMESRGRVIFFEPLENRRRILNGRAIGQKDERNQLDLGVSLIELLVSQTAIHPFVRHTLEPHG